MSLPQDQTVNQLRKTSIVEDYHPVVRRRAITSIRSTLPSYLTDFFDNIKQQEYYQGLQKSQKIILDHFNKIHQIIDVVDDHIRRRIQCYENEVVNVVQKQIDQMREQTHNVVQQFNTMISQKNKETQIWSLNNELDYFKSQAKKLFDTNKKLKSENKQLKKMNQEYVWELENKEVVMQKIHLKYLKEKHYKQKLHKQINQSKTQMEMSQEYGKHVVAQYSKELDKQIKHKKSVSDSLSKFSKPIQNCNKQNQTLKLNIFQVQLDEENQKLGESIAIMNQFTNQFNIQHYTESRLIDLPQNSVINVNFQQDEESDFNINNFKVLSPNGKSQSVQKNSFLYVNKNVHQNKFSKDEVIKVDYACQTNIYLSQSDYREYFKKSIKGQKSNANQNLYSPKTKQISQIQVQTQNTYHYQNTQQYSNFNNKLKTQSNNNEYTLYDDAKQRLQTVDNLYKKDIDFVKNGFFVNDVSQINKKTLQKENSRSRIRDRYEKGRENFSSGNLLSLQDKKRNNCIRQQNSYGTPLSRNQNKSMGKKVSLPKNKNSTQLNYYKNKNKNVNNNSPNNNCNSNSNSPDLNYININIVQNPQKNQNQNKNNNQNINNRYLGKEKKQKRQNTKMLMKFQNSKIRSREFRNIASKSVLD